MADPNRKYAVTLSYFSTKPLIELVNENLTIANYSHNAKRTRVVSVRGEFVKLLGGLYKDAGISTMHELFIHMALGKYHIESKLWRKFINGVANCVGYSDMPTQTETLELYGIICKDYEANNPHLKAEIWSKVEAPEYTLYPKDEVDEAPAESKDEVPAEVGAGATV